MICQSRHFTAKRQRSGATTKQREAIKLDPNFALAYAMIADSYATTPAYPYLSPNEAFPQAKAAAKRALEIDPTLEAARKIHELESNFVLGRYLLGLVYNVNGVRNFSELGKAYQERDWRLPLLKVDPFMDPLRDDPRFKDLVRRIGLPELK